MPIAEELRRGLIACVLIGAALSSAALTLDRSRGTAQIGRPLDIALPLSLDTAGQADDLCPATEVFAGDSRVDASRATVRLESTRRQNAVVPVRSSQPGAEPWRAVDLRLGCTQQTAHSDVLIAQGPSELPAPAAVAPVAAAPTFAPAPPVAVAAPGAAASGSGRILAPSQPQRSDGSHTPARLNLHKLDLLPERDPSLRSSPRLKGQPSTSEKVRTEAAALWRSMNAQPQDVLRDLERVKALEAELKTIRSLVAANDRTLAELREQLAQAQKERTPTLAVVVLLSLLLAAVLVTWWLRRATRSGQRNGWRRAEPVAGAASTDVAARLARPAAGAPGRVEGADLRVDESMVESLKAASRSATAEAGDASDAADAADAAGSAGIAGGPGMATAAAAQAVVPACATLLVPRPAATAATAPASSEPLSSFHSALQSSRMVKAEEPIDIQQQADFFMSLGQPDQAIEVLASHIRNNVKTSALVWLDLLAIYRSLKRPEDYELLRGDFQRVFNAQLPTYDSMPTASGGLEDDRRALRRIAALWPSPEVMDGIEESIFRKPGAGDDQPVDLEAYRELVMLFDDEVLRDLDAAVSVSRDSGHAEAGPLSRPADPDFKEATDTPIDVDSMLGDAQGPETGPDWTRDSMTPRPSPRLGLDIDLSALAELAKPPAVPDFDTDSTVDFGLAEPGDEAADQPRKK